MQEHQPLHQLLFSQPPSWNGCCLQAFEQPPEKGPNNVPKWGNIWENSRNLKICLFSVIISPSLEQPLKDLNLTWHFIVSGLLYKCKLMCASRPQNQVVPQQSRGRMEDYGHHLPTGTSVRRSWSRQSSLLTLATSTPISMGTDTALAKTKQELLTQCTLPKMEPMQTSKRKLMPVLSLLFHIQLLRQSSASLYHSNPGAKAEDSNYQKYRGWKVWPVLPHRYFWPATDYSDSEPRTPQKSAPIRGKPA